MVNGIILLSLLMLLLHPYFVILMEFHILLGYLLQQLLLKQCTNLLKLPLVVLRMFKGLKQIFKEESKNLDGGIIKELLFKFKTL